MLNAPLFSIKNYEFHYRHLLVIGILVIAFSISFLIRYQPAEYGFELNEFDPFFNFRATEFIVENGLPAYFDWHDDMSWYPNGRNISATSQVMLHVTASTTYQIFGGSTSLYDYTILFPAIIGSLTVFVIFGLVRVISGTTSGLFAALLFSVSLPIILRGTLGWFKSEPLGLFYGLLGLYFFLSGVRSNNGKIAISKVIAGGIFLGFGLASWGGNQFFILPIGIFILSLPFIRKDFQFLIKIIPIFVISILLTVLMFERPGSGFVFGLGGFSLIIPTLFLIACIFVQKISKIENQLRNGLILLFSVLIIGSSLIVINIESEFLSLPSFRYLNVINPFLTTLNPLVDSVAEHATTTINQSFLFHSMLMIFAGLGIWMIFNKKITQNFSGLKNDMILFSLILGLIGVYVSSAFVRLEVFASISLIVLSSMGVSIMMREILKKNTKNFSNLRNLVKLPFLFGFVIILTMPLMIPVNGNWVNSADVPPTILNGGTSYITTTNDWKDSLDWIKLNTPKDSVIAAWWDYGYWITTMSDRKTLADNATIDQHQIEKIAKIFISSPDTAWSMLRDTDSDYVVVFISGEKLNITAEDRPLYLLRGGGDESKKSWFVKITGEPVEKYVHSDGISSTDYFWNETLLGQMFPFSLLGYVNPADNNQQSLTYVPGFIPVYVSDVKYPSDGNGPLKLVYSSPSFTAQEAGPMIGIFVYEINSDYSLFTNEEQK